MNVRSTGKLLNVAYGSDNKVALSVIHSHVETHRCIPIKCTCTQLHSICCRYVYYVFLPMYWLRRQHLNSVVFSSLTVTVTSSCSRVLYHGWICVVFRFSFFFFFFFCYLLVVQFVLLPLLVDLFCVAWRFGWVWILTQISVYILCAADGYFIVFYNCFMFISYFFFLCLFLSI